MIVLILLLLASNNFAQDDSIKKLFPGKWKMISDKQEYYEQWEIVNETELTGIGFSIEERDTVNSEKLYLKIFDDTWAYVAIPVDQPITLFALVEFSQNKFAFENGEHDFPQRIIYEFVSDSTLNAKIEGVIEGELMSREFSFIKVDK